MQKAMQLYVKKFGSRVLDFEPFIFDVDICWWWKKVSVLNDWFILLLDMKSSIGWGSLWQLTWGILFAILEERLDLVVYDNLLIGCAWSLIFLRDMVQLVNLLILSYRNTVMKSVEKKFMYFSFSWWRITTQ